MWRNSDFKIYFSVLKIYFKAMVPSLYISAKAATHSFGLFFLRRVLCGALPYRFSIATHSFLPFSLRRVLFPSCCFLSRPRRRVLWRFLCVVSWVIAFLCGSVPRRIVSGCFSCVVSYLMSSSVVKGWVKPEMRCRIRTA